MSPLGSILGNTNVLKWIIKYPEAVHRLAEKVIRYNINVSKLIIEKYGASKCNVVTQVPLESNNVLSAETFEKFCLPYISELHGFYVESGVRATIIHLCGNHKDNLLHWRKVPFPKRTIFSIGNDMSLEETGEFLGEKYILAGNISSTTLQVGTKSDILKEVKRCLDQAMHRPGGFILMPACEWPPLAPQENIEYVREALMKYGFY
jgi:uroporphyrinogen decarboxylase